ncbi:MAG: hypothetical protein FWF08_06570 [Oscillospiraceae bacterium]|nr:hypothetical protein [Oscillospiraceae bacterium]
MKTIFKKKNIITILLFVCFCIYSFPLTQERSKTRGYLLYNTAPDNPLALSFIETKRYDKTFYVLDEPAAAEWENGTITIYSCYRNNIFTNNWYSVDGIVYFQDINLFLDNYTEWGDQRKLPLLKVKNFGANIDNDPNRYYYPDWINENKTEVENNVRYHAIIEQNKYYRIKNYNLAFADAEFEMNLTKVKGKSRPEEFGCTANYGDISMTAVPLDIGGILHLKIFPTSNIKDPFDTHTGGIFDSGKWYDDEPPEAYLTDGAGNEITGEWVYNDVYRFDAPCDSYEDYTVNINTTVKIFTKLYSLWSSYKYSSKVINVSGDDFKMKPINFNKGNKIIFDKLYVSEQDGQKICTLEYHFIKEGDYNAVFTFSAFKGDFKNNVSMNVKVFSEENNGSQCKTSWVLSADHKKIKIDLKEVHELYIDNFSIPLYP